MKNFKKYCYPILFAAAGFMGSIIIAPFIAMVFILIATGESWEFGKNKTENMLDADNMIE